MAKAMTATCDRVVPQFATATQLVNSSDRFDMAGSTLSFCSTREVEWQLELPLRKKKSKSLSMPEKETQLRSLGRERETLD